MTLNKGDLTATAMHVALKDDALVPTSVAIGPTITPPATPYRKDVDSTDDDALLPHVYDEEYPFEVSYREYITFARVARFFFDPKHEYANLRTLVSIKTRQSDISLRLIEFFLTKYVCNNGGERDIGYFVADGTKRGRYFNVGLNYKNGLEMYTKKGFDFFARGSYKFVFGVRGKQALHITTSLRQLNFFKWAIQNKVIDYVRKHRERIMACMKRADQEERASKKRARDDMLNDDGMAAPPAKRICTSANRQ